MSDGLKLRFLSDCPHGPTGAVAVMSASTARSLITRGIACLADAPVVKIVVDPRTASLAIIAAALEAKAVVTLLPFMYSEDEDLVLAAMGAIAKLSDDPLGLIATYRAACDAFPATAKVGK
jgi:hypothetical protein